MASWSTFVGISSLLASCDDWWMGWALLRLNRLHIHLSDDQGWRFESKKWPKLTEFGAWRSGTVVGRPARYHDGNLYSGKLQGHVLTASGTADFTRRTSCAS